MTVKVTTNSVSSCLPYSRTKLLDEVILERKHGPVHQAWISTGHLHILLDGGKKLVTFDCKNADYIQETENAGCLDLDVTVPILTILTQPPQSVLVVQVNGHIQQWKYRKDFTWKLHAEFDICNAVRSEVTDICLNITHNALYWCEKRNTSTEKATFCICKRQIIEDDGKGGPVTLGPVAALIHNCPDSCLYPMGHGVLIITEEKPPMVSVRLRLCGLTGKIHLVIRDDLVPLTELSTHNAIEFRHIVLKCLQHINKSRSDPKMMGSTYFLTNQKYIQVLQNGHLAIITNDTEPRNIISDIYLEKFMAAGVTGVMAVQGQLGICYDNHIVLYSIETGKCVGRTSSPDDATVLGMCRTLLGTNLAAFYTPHDLYLIQKSQMPERSGEEAIMECNLFQTDAVKLAFLDKLQQSTRDTSNVPSMDKLRERWMSELGRPANTKLVAIVEPFLTEYWKLENMLQESQGGTKVIPKMKPLSVKDEVERLLDPKSAISRSGRQAQLLLLSQHAPQEVLAAMLSYLDLGEGELSTSQLQKWQCVLTQETADVAGSCSIAVPLFEQICHLLYKQRPNQLMKFLRRCQQVCDQKVGVSAFIRKRQTLLVYERALKCIPEPEQSVDIDAAVFVYVQILLVSEVDRSVQKAVRCLLRYRKWAEAIDLLREHTDGSRQRVVLYHMVLAALTQNEVLHQFSEQIFSLMPSLQCCVELAASGKDDGNNVVFCESSSDISLRSVRPHLLKCLHNKDDSKEKYDK